jgi:hypothetical protein
MVPQLAEAGPCSSDIAELVTTIQQPSVKALRTAISQCSTAPPVNAGIREAGRRAFAVAILGNGSAAKRLDMYGERVGCTGALNAVRRMYVLVDKQ